MAINLKETAGGLRHLLLGCERMLLRRSPNHFWQKFVNILPANCTLSDSSATCPICGYAVVKLTLAGGWLFQTCSATGLETILAPGFADWALSLSEQPCQLSNKQRVNLPRQNT